MQKHAWRRESILWEFFITLRRLSLRVDNEILSHALLCLFTSVCLEFSKAFLIIYYWHSCGEIFDLSGNDIIIVGIKGPRLHFPLRQMKRQMGKIKNSIWSAKHTFRHAQTWAHCASYSDSLRSGLKSGAALMINERSIATLSVEVLLPDTHKHTTLSYFQPFREHRWTFSSSFANL